MSRCAEKLGVIHFASRFRSLPNFRLILSNEARSLFCRPET